MEIPLDFIFYFILLALFAFDFFRFLSIGLLHSISIKNFYWIPLSESRHWKTDLPKSDWLTCHSIERFSHKHARAHSPVRMRDFHYETHCTITTELPIHCSSITVLLQPHHLQCTSTTSPLLLIAAY